MDLDLAVSKLGDYGFLTRDGFLGQSIHRDLSKKKSKSILHRSNVSMSNRKQVKSVDFTSGLPVVTEDTKKVGENTSWWKSMFKSKKQSHIKKANLKKHFSDSNLSRHCSKSVETKLRARRCKSVVVNNSIELFDEADLSTTTPLTANNDVNISPKKSLKNFSISSQASALSHRNENENHNHNLASFNSKLPVIAEGNESKARCEKQVKKVSSRKKKAKPIKPPRKHLSINETTLPSLLTLKETKSKEKSKMKRSLSLFSLRNPFSKKNKASKQKAKENGVKKSTSDDNFFEDLRNKCDATDSERNTLNIYEKYPRRKQEQPKFLVHIQTRYGRCKFR